MEEVRRIAIMNITRTLLSNTSSQFNKSAQAFSKFQTSHFLKIDQVFLPSLISESLPGA